jgi:hypothetical protein
LAARLCFLLSQMFEKQVPVMNSRAKTHSF